MTNQDCEQKKRECWKVYCQIHPLCNTQSVKNNFDWIFDRAYALGKQEKDADTVIQGWVARDKDGHIFLYEARPERVPFCKPSEWGSGRVMTELSVDSFPDLTWDDDPQEVEIQIKIKQNG